MVEGLGFGVYGVGRRVARCRVRVQA